MSPREEQLQLAVNEAVRELRSYLCDTCYPTPGTVMIGDKPIVECPICRSIRRATQILNEVAT